MDQKVHSITNTCFQHPFPPTAVPPFVLACYPLSFRIPSFVPSCPLSSICPILLSVLISSFSVIICPSKSYPVTLECSAIINVVLCHALPSPILCINSYPSLSFFYSSVSCSLCSFSSFFDIYSRFCLVFLCPLMSLFVLHPGLVVFFGSC